MGKSNDISGLNALSAYDGVIRMPLVGNGIYGTGDKMSDTMNATKAITSRSSFWRGRCTPTHNESNVWEVSTEVNREWRNSFYNISKHSKLNLKNI
jgi:hypothetical protein